jgi:RNA polymerase sigma factor (TIGR02999 family)
MDRSDANRHEVTRLLSDYAHGDVRSFDEAVALVYQELRGLARNQLRRSGVRREVQTTMLVHEAYEKLAVGQVQQMKDRRHFFAIASRAMRQIVVDMYRASNAAKRGGDAQMLTLTSNPVVDGDRPEQILAVDQALKALAGHDQELAEIVDLTCFGGLDTQQIAELTGTTVRTVQRKLQRAQAWLAHFMADA